MRCAKQSRTWLSLGLGLLAVAAFAVPGVAQQRGKVVGKVLESGSGNALSGAQVFIPGTGIGALTGADGAYQLSNVPAGPASVRVTMIGYGSHTDKVTVPAGGTVQANFELHQTAVALNQLVVTGAGVATERRKLGNTVASVNIAKLTEKSSASNVTQLLQARVPGVNMETSGGLAGEGMRITIRGGASVTQYNQPIVYVDGVRVDASGGWASNLALAGGAAAPSALANLNPDDIARIEVLKGAAAATLYGTEASSGVIQIFTKQGAAGATHYNIQVQEGLGFYPSNAYHPLAGFVTDSSVGGVTWAQYESKYWGQTITPYQPFEVNIIPWAYGTGHHRTYSLGVSGGSRKFTYHVSGRYQYQNGPFGGQKHFSTPDFQLAQDISSHKQANASLTFFPTDRLRFRVTSAYTESYFETPQAGNNIFAGFSQLLDSKPEHAGCAGQDNLNINNIKAPMTCSPAFPANQTGVLAFATAREGWLLRQFQNTQMFEGSLNGNWQITPKLIADVTFGVEHEAIRAVGIVPFHWNVDHFTSFDVAGDRTVGNTLDHRLTLDAHLNWNANFSNFSSQATIGSQIFDTQRNNTSEDGNEFPGPGIEVAGAGALQSIGESYLKEVQVGVFGQEQIGWKDFAFLTVGARFDRHSAFGANAPSVVYPKASISIVPSSLDSWHSSLLSTFRLRAAIGQSGRQPGAFDKYRTFGPLNASTGAGLGPANLGNQNLKPEITTEIEGGGNLGLFNDRVGVDITYWHRVVNDLLYPKQYAPSGGFNTAQLTNIGQMKAHGLELGVNAQVFQHKNLGLSLFANGEYLHQIVTSLGGAPPIKVDGAYPRPRNFIKVGYAPGAFFGAVLQKNLPSGTYPISVNSGCTPATKDQLMALLSQPINPGNLHVLVQGGDYLHGPGCSSGDFLANYEGKPTPDWSGAFGGTLNFLRNFSLTANFEYKLGNYTLEDLWTEFSKANPLIGRNTPLSAATTATLENPASTPEQRFQAALTWAHKLDGLAPVSGLNAMYNGDFIRMREIDLSYNVPKNLAAKIGAKTASVTLSGRNIWMVWTKYPGPDPEMNWQGITSGFESATSNINNNFLIGDNGWGLPQPHEFTLAVRASF